MIESVSVPRGSSFLYPANRAPLSQNSMVRLPWGAVQPQGWMKEVLHRQKDGLNGHLGEISAWLQKKDNAWLSQNGKGAWGWEEVPYWLRGYSALGMVLQDEKILEETKIWIEGVFQSVQKNGYFGPRRRAGLGTDHWGNMVMLYCLQSWFDWTGDQRVISLMTGYFRHLKKSPNMLFLTGYWQRMRGGDMIHSVHWLYNRTGEEWLLNLVEKIHKNTANWCQKEGLPNWHNVNIAQAFREPAQYGQQKNDPSFLKQSYDVFHRIREQYGHMPGGMWAGDENSRPGHDDPHQAVETCGLAEQMFSNYMMLEMCGDSFWAENTEDVAFNSLPAALTEDMRSLRYLTAPNMPASDRENHAPGVENKGPFFLMNPVSSRCCQHNHGFAWPYYVAHQWMASGDEGLVALFYGESAVEAKVAGGKMARIEQKGHYPFDDVVRFTIQSEEKASFPLYFRIPSWCSSPKLQINGKDQVLPGNSAGSYLREEREWRPGDIVELKLPREVKIRRWKKNHDSLSVDYGALTFSLRIPENKVNLKGADSPIWDSKWQDGFDESQWLAQEILPADAWNYGLVLNSKDIQSSFQVEMKDWPENDYPWNLEQCPLEIHTKGSVISEWDFDKDGLCGELQDSPVSTGNPVDDVRLVPMGAARIRISSFPEVDSQGNAPHWQSEKK
ncbi:MAG: glycoside hydrolase family 127 protein [Spirochaetales bacterium]|nr:glycoside hydrolase family 127 protein [Spirochaetales bacterium]